jgi:hypothetical protein
MKHIHTIARPQPAILDSSNSIWCQLAVLLGSIGVPVSKDLVNKCLGV